MTLYPQMIIEALQTVTYAGTKKNLVESGMVADQPAVAAPPPTASRGAYTSYWSFRATPTPF